MQYKIIKEDVSEIASKEEIEKFEKAQVKVDNFAYGAAMPPNELFDMCMYFKILLEAERNRLFKLHLAQKMGEGVNGYHIAFQRQKIAKYMTAVRFWGKILQEELDAEGKTFDVTTKLNELMKIIISESKYENTKSKKIVSIRENKQKILEWLVRLHILQHQRR